MKPGERSLLTFVAALITTAVLVILLAELVRPQSPFHATLVTDTEENTRNTQFWPRDPLFGQQQGLRKSGFPVAWASAKGTGIKVATVDSGVASAHPDLAGKVEAQKDFLNGDPVAEDTIGHGTHVGATIAAATNNDEGIAGGCPNCRLIVAKALDLSGGSASDISKAIRWSVNEGAKVVNVSSAGPADEELESAVDYAEDNGTVVVAAVTNQGGADTKYYPAAYDTVLAVAATDESDKIASPSCHGHWVDVVAPGTDIISASLDGGYRSDSGTSFAAPQVAALAALLVEQGYNPREVRSLIKETAVDLGTPGLDECYGYGRINAARAVQISSGD